MMAEVAAVLARKNLAAGGVLSRRSSGALCIKSFSAARFILDQGAIDILDINVLGHLSGQATELSERLIALGLGLTQAAK